MVVNSVVGNGGYARERDDARAHQRKALQKADFFASGPPKIWADRSIVLRRNIERVFEHFRELRRELAQLQVVAQQRAAPIPQAAATP